MSIQGGQRLLLSDHELEQTAVVANNAMNRERGLSGVNSYARGLGLDPVDWLSSRHGKPAWLDLCSGEAHALITAAATLGNDVTVTGVDLVGRLSPGPSPQNLELVTASLARWSPTRTHDLITCVHGLHYLGDKLGLLARAASWLTPDGMLIAHLDPDSLRLEDGRPAARPMLRALRAAGFQYDSRRHLIALHGLRTVALPFTYLGADPNAGPNYTGQPAVASYYRPSPEIAPERE